MKFNKSDVKNNKTSVHPESTNSSVLNKPDSENTVVAEPDFLPVEFSSFDSYPALSVFPDFMLLEPQVTKFWKQSFTVEKYLIKDTPPGTRFSFLDGPITANNPMGVHHAWGRTLKDVYLRYHRSLNKTMRFQNGFDCQGLWVEVGVEQSLKLNSKKEIYDYGLDKFTDACRARVEKFGNVITEQSRQLGQWMDWDNSYWTHTDKNIEYIWFFLKKCQENGWLYKGHRVMPWCYRCGTSLSQHEQMDSYQNMTHPSIFVHFPVKNYLGHFTAFEALLAKHFPQKLPKVSLLVWTTTPWTLPANVAVAAHLELEYVLVKPKDEQKESKNWLVLGKNAFKGLEWLQKTHESVLSFSGEKLVGNYLEGPCQSFVPKQDDVKVHVVAWDEVSEEEGTGLVHIAPGCGAEDNELGKKLGLPTLAPLSENGDYMQQFGFDGVFFKEVSNNVTKKLEDLGLLSHKTTLVHRYPTCWRCHEELVYRLVDEWFLSTEEIRPMLLVALEEISWEPFSLKGRMRDWLNNMGDWCISRKRFWGLPLPFYECPSCNRLQVFGRVKELWKAAGLKSQKAFDKLVPDLHRPHIDKVQVTCEKCGKKISRIPEVGDCWLDAGVVPFSTLDYLEDHSSESYWARWFPADLVLEMREQLRLWFYSMLFMSVTLVGKAPYKHVVAYEKVLDAKGEAMHRSKGNALWFYEAAEKIGADPNRWFYAGWDLSKPLLYGFDNVKESLRPLMTLWSCTRFLQQNLLLTPVVWKKLSTNPEKVTDLTDAWLVNELQLLDKEVAALYESYKVTKVIQRLSAFWDMLSTFWLRNNRQRFWNAEETTGKQLKVDVKLAYQLLWKAVFLSIKWVAPIVPYFSETVYQTVLRPASAKFPQSVHLLESKSNKFPRLTKVQKDSLLSTELVLNLIETGRQLRQTCQIKNRYRLPELYLFNESKPSEVDLVNNWKSVFEFELNVETVHFKKPEKLESFKMSETNGWLFYLNPEVSEEWQLEWKRADILRTVQFLRKKANLPLTKTVSVGFKTKNYNRLKRVLSDNFKNKLNSEAFVNIVDDKDESWARKKVKGMELEVFLQN